MADPVMRFLHKHRLNPQGAGPDTVVELRSLLLSFYPNPIWDAKAQHWVVGDQGLKPNPDWFHRAAEIPFIDEIHFGILRLLIMQPFVPDRNARYKMSAVTMQRLERVNLLARLEWINFPPAMMPTFFELAKTNTAWIPNNNKSSNLLYNICLSRSLGEDRAALIRYLGNRLEGMECYEGFIDHITSGALGLCEGLVSDVVIRAAIDVWAYCHKVSVDIAYQRLGERKAVELITSYGNIIPSTQHLQQLTRWIDTSLLIMFRSEEPVPHRPEMIAEWPVHRDSNGRWAITEHIPPMKGWVRRWQLERAYRVLAMIVLLGGQDEDGELRVSNVLIEAGSHQETAKRFFRIVAKLPMELQEILASMVVVLEGVIITRLREVPEYTWRWALKQ